MNPLETIKSFSKEVGNAASAAAKLKEAEQDLGDLKDIYEVRNKNIESQIALDKIRLKNKDLTAKEEQEREKQRKDSIILQFHNQEEITREMLQTLVEKITVYPDGKIEILWKFRDELNHDRNKK